uniref:M3 family metallopeptidase n=1 Tax=Clavibacter michiganensis TaxID=28447 RepID=UPI00292EEA97
NDLAVVFDDVAELDGLSEGEVSAAAQAATARGLDGRYVVTLTLYTGHPSLASLTNRESRRRVLEASRSRGTRGNAHDNRDVLREIVRVRAERAALLGYPSHAAAILADQTAGSPEAVHDLLRRLAVPAAENARSEQAALQRLAEADGIRIEAHDWAFYTEKVRAAEYDLDRAALRPWFEAERVLR